MPARRTRNRQVKEHETVILKEVETITEELNLEALTEVREKEDKMNPQVLSVLVHRAQKDDHEAFAKIYDEFVTPIYRYISFRVPKEMVEDLVSDVFVKAWQKIHTYKDRKNIPFSSWLFRIARNTVIDTYRTQKPVDELSELMVDEDRWNDPTLRITQERQTVILKAAMEKLPKRYREVLLMSFVSDLPHEEIARSLRMRTGSVRILKHRALKKLSELLPASMKEELP